MQFKYQYHQAVWATGCEHDVNFTLKGEKSTLYGRKWRRQNHSHAHPLRLSIRLIAVTSSSMKIKYEFLPRVMPFSTASACYATFYACPDFDCYRKHPFKREKRLFLNIKQNQNLINETSEKFGLPIRPEMLVKHLSVGEKQRVEIFKALFRKANVLILDERRLF
jgi:ABC-type sugar transport system ATPase subunit